MRELRRLPNVLTPWEHAPSFPRRMIYEQLLDADGEWAMSEGSRYFEDGGAVQVSLRKIARRLQDLGIPYAIAGGMALFAHGFRRFTEDVDLLVTGEGLKQIHRELQGAGY